MDTFQICKDRKKFLKIYIFFVFYIIARGIEKSLSLHLKSVQRLWS